MTVTQIPADGASKRFKAAQENAMAEKVQLVEKVAPSHTDNLRRKVEAGDILDIGNQSKFGQMIRQYANEKWSFKTIMNAFEVDTKTHEKLMYQRQAIEELFNWIDRGVMLGKEARQQLAQEEKSKA